MSQLLSKAVPGWVLFLVAFFLSGAEQAAAQTCVFDSPILASTKPFDNCPCGVDTIIIRDTFNMDLSYEPIICGVPFEGVLLVDGGVINYTSNATLKLGYFARLVLINDGCLHPGIIGDPDCNPARRLLFDVEVLASCNGTGASHAFSDINQAGCIDVIGICCNALILETDNSGLPNDRVLCTPGDTAIIEVEGSGTLDYDYFWFPNLGLEAGPYVVTPQNTTTYSVSITGLFDPYIGDPYVLTCSGSITIKVNSDINANANTTPVPCAGTPVGAIDVSVSGGTTPYTYLWSNGAVTQDLTNVDAGDYTVTITDKVGCTEVRTFNVGILDNIPPVINCPASVIDTADLNSCSTVVFGLDAAFSDNCPSVALLYNLFGATSGSGTGQLSGVVPFNAGITTVEYIANDGLNATTCTFTVQVRDIQPPTASHPADITGIQCLVDIPVPDASLVLDEDDNCGIQSVSFFSESPAGGSGCPGDPFVLIRTYRVTDLFGNTTLVTHNIQVADTEAPVFLNAPLDTVVDCQSIPSPASMTATDNCSAAVNLVFIGETQQAGPCPYTYDLLRTWSATDDCGNVKTFRQVITVQDTIRPVFNAVPADATVSCENVPPVGIASATDNCSPVVGIQYEGETRIDGPCPDTYVLQRLWTATDDCGNTSTAMQEITVQDLTAPVFTYSPPDLTVFCESVPVADQPQASDNCTALVNIMYDGEIRTDGNCVDNYTLVRSWTAYDDCGNSLSITQEITVRDITPPDFVYIPADTVVNCDAIPPPTDPPSATDNCADTPTITYNGETIVPGNCPNEYVLLRQWTAVDNCGNTSSARQVLTVQDTTRPIFIYIPPDLTVDCDAVPGVDTPIAGDNCPGDVVITYDGETRTDGACPDAYILQRQWTATDACGNSETAVQTLTVQDTTLPVFTFIPADTVVNCDAVPPPGTPTATDNCTANVSIAYLGETRTDGACPDSYTLLRQWTATDDCGNVATAEQILTVQDTTQPVFTFIPADTVVNCDAVPPPGAPASTDNCTANVTITYDGETRTDGACPDSYTLRRQWTATDDCGNSTIAEQILTVQDTTLPLFTFVPADTLVNCDAVPPPGAPEASDNCTASVSITYDGETRTDGACPDQYILRRQWTATDDCGNSTIAEQILSVQDTTLPQFTFVPADTLVDCDAVPPPGTPEATDNCTAGVTITYDGEVRTDGPCPNSYTLFRQWTAADDCGNSTTAGQTLLVQDTTLPVFTFIPADTLVNCDAVPAAGLPTATDNCTATVSLAYDGEVRTDGPCPNEYTLRRQWTATDECGNTSIAEQLLTVQDTTKPVFTFVPVDTVVNCDAVPGPGVPTATDNCTANVSIIYDGETRINGPCPDSYTLRRQWTAMDACNNINRVIQILTVQDTTQPVFLFVPADTIVNCDMIPPPGMPTASDNCDNSVDITFNGETTMPGSSQDSYFLERLWIAVDNCGNTQTAVQVLTVQDTVSPMILCPPDISVFADPDLCAQIVNFDAPVTADNCSNALIVTGTAASGDTFTIGTTLVSYLASDPTGNAAGCSFAVMVVDTTAPVLVNCPPDLTFTSLDTSCFAIGTWTPPIVTDVCDGGYVITPVPDFAPGSLFPTGNTLVTYTATDTTGNVQTCSFTVTVEETIPPVLSNCPPNITLTTDTCSAVAIWNEPQATDNCALDTVVVNIPSGSVFFEGVTTVIYTATDLWGGNTVSCSFTVTVFDEIPPQLASCPPDTVVSSGLLCEIPVSFDLPDAIDNCTGTPLIYSIPAPGDTFPVGHTWVDVFVEDPSGNKDSCRFQVTVLGPPLGFTDIPADQNFIACEAVATWTPPTPTGVCGPITITGTHAPGDTFPIGSTVVVYTVSDTLGYSATASFVITVTESIPPVFDCPGSPVLVDISGAIFSDPGQFITGTDTVYGCVSVELFFNLPPATDNCLPPDVEQIGGIGSAGAFDIGSHIVVFQATDDAGNTAICTVQIDVDSLYPLQPMVSDRIGCPGDDISLTVPAFPGAVYTWTGPQPPYPNDSTLVITGLSAAQTGYYTVQADLNGCLTPLDSALVRIGMVPDAVDDIDLEIEPGGLLDSFSVLINDDYVLDDFTVEQESALTGLTHLGDGLFSYQAGNKNGRVSFVYQLCSEACPDLCDRAVVTITIRETICSYIPNIITPNGDGINDYLEIPCLETDLYPNNALTIYNQWGDVVFKAAPYNNSPLTAWQGTFMGEDGRDLPDATYFYIFKPSPDAPALRGFVEVFR